MRITSQESDFESPEVRTNRVAPGHRRRSLEVELRGVINVEGRPIGTLQSELCRIEDVCAGRGLKIGDVRVAQVECILNGRAGKIRTREVLAANVVPARDREVVVDERGRK